MTAQAAFLFCGETWLRSMLTASHFVLKCKSSKAFDLENRVMISEKHLPLDNMFLVRKIRQSLSDPTKHPIRVAMLQS